MLIVTKSDRNLTEPDDEMPPEGEHSEELALMIKLVNQEMDQDGKDLKRVTFKLRKVNLCIRLKGV